MSHYGRKGKEPYHYSTWVREHRNPPENIQRELEIARRRSAQQNRFQDEYGETWFDEYEDTL